MNHRRSNGLDLTVSDHSVAGGGGGGAQRGRKSSKLQEWKLGVLQNLHLGNL